MIFHCPYLQSDETRHSADCTKCRHKTRAQNLRDEAERVNVHYYEKLLPENHAEQMAVSYELRLPPLLGLQRDALKILARDLCVPEGYTQSHEMRGFWAHEDRLAPWLQAAGLVGALGSTTKSFRASRYQAQHVTKRETAAATTEPLFCHHCDSRLPQLLGPALGNVLARLQEVYIQGFKLNGEAFLSTPVFEEMWDKLRRSFPRDVVKEGPASSSDEEGLIQANATLEVHPMHFSMGPQGSLLYVLVALAGDGHYVQLYVLVALAGDGHYIQLAQHVHHAMDHISD